MQEQFETVVDIKTENGCDDLFPKKAHDDDAAFDLYSQVDFELRHNEVKVVPVGFSMELQSGWEAQIRPRSGWAAKTGLMVVNSPGTIDAGYRGLIQVILKNTGVSSVGGDLVRFKRGDRIAQMVIQRIPKVLLRKVDKLSESIRGENGLGSTNKKV
jgi:dUTP pyrophosphatase